MTHALSDTHLVLLSNASQREDRCLVALDSVKGVALQKAGVRLVKLGFVQEIKARRGLPVWRKDDQGSFALRLTAAGLAAISAHETEAENSAASEKQPVEAAESGAGAVTSSFPSGAPRPGTKLATVIGLLQGDAGATVGELIAATGWLAHTTRAALTGLRKRGYAISLDRSDKSRGSAYRIAA